MASEINSLLETARLIRNSVEEIYKPPAEGIKPKSEHVLASAIVKGSRGYVEKVVDQVNGSYENGLYDCCSVMIRRLIETLIIECYEKYKIENEIKDVNGDYISLKFLIDKFLNETRWTLGREPKRAIPKFKKIGDFSAHSRRYNAVRPDIDKIMDDLRVVVQELIYLSGLK
jgi:hypothetical protein